jgi:hypothetical protein
MRFESMTYESNLHVIEAQAKQSEYCASICKTFFFICMNYRHKSGSRVSPDCREMRTEIWARNAHRQTLTCANELRNRWTFISLDGTARRKRTEEISLKVSSQFYLIIFPILASFVLMPPIRQNIEATVPILYIDLDWWRRRKTQTRDVKYL